VRVVSRRSVVRVVVSASLVNRPGWPSTDYRDRVDAPETDFERTVLPLLPDCWAFALSLTRRHADAEDLVQDAFLRAQRSFDSFTPGTNAKAWLFTILRRLHIDRHRRARLRPAYLPEEELEGVAAARGAAEGPPVEGHGISPADVVAALRDVPDAFRLAVRLRDVDGLSYAEIGRVLGVPPGTVMSRIHRGRECLRTLLVRPGAAERAVRNPRT
jgi:RNA polymerase sigma-70 factor (ECF subfamily)